MLRVIVQNGSPAGQQFQFDPYQQQILLFGRGEDCHVRFTETGVSLRHALIVSKGDNLYVFDQGSANGTFVNGERVASASLRHMDIIELGPYGPRLQVISEEADQSSCSDSIPYLSKVDTESRYVPPTARGNIRETAKNIGLYDPIHDTGQSPIPVRAGCLLIIFAVFGLMVLGLAILDLGIGVALISSIIAFIPAMVYLSVFLWLDRFDPEPPATLAFAFAWGATISILISGIFNGLFGVAIGETLTGIISAPIIEEGSKGVGVLLIALLLRKDFDSVVDGIVYAGVVALGFATMENIDYYGRSFVHGGVGSLIGTFFIRGVLAPFSHVLFTSMTGIGCGIARETHSQILKLVAPAAGYLGAMFLHALWNVLASFDGETFLMGYLLLQVPLFVIFVGVIIFLVRREGRILRKTLASEVERGLITPQQLEIAISVFRRTSWVLSAFGNARLFNARRQFLRAVAKLGLCHWHKARATEAQRDTGSLPLISKLQAEVLALRDEVG